MPGQVLTRLLEQLEQLELGLFVRQTRQTLFPDTDSTTRDTAAPLVDIGLWAIPVAS